MHLSPPARALGTELKWKAAARNSMPGLVSAASAAFAIKSAERWREPVPGVWCLVSGFGSGAQKVLGRGGGDGATLPQAFIGENAGGHLVLFLPLLEGGWKGRSSVASLLLSLSSLAWSRSSISCWSCLSSLFIWVLM